MTHAPMTLALPAAKRRNPIALPARQRLAGAHGRSGGAERQRQRRDLRRELHHLDPRGP